MHKRFDKRAAYGALHKMGLLSHLNLHAKRRTNGRAIKIPIIGGVGIANLGQHEPWISHAIKMLLPLKVGCFMDVGVNLGQTLIKVFTHDRGRQYYGFEPNPMCAGYVEQLIRVNEISNAQVIPVGLSDSDTVSQLFLRDEYDREASITPQNRGEDYYGFCRYVPCFSGDRLVADFDIETISILKIDVEGAEREVLAGCRDILKKKRPFVLCEILPVYDEVSENGKLRRSRTDETLGILSDADYEIFRIQRDGQPKPLDTIETHGDLRQTDYLFIPSEFRHEFSAGFHGSG